MAATLTAGIQHVDGIPFTPSVSDLKMSTIIYNGLPHVDSQLEIPKHHLVALLDILRSYDLGEQFGFHLLHRHDKIEEGMVRMEVELKARTGTWTKPVPIEEVNLANLHGSLFMLQFDGHFVAFEYREGLPRPSLTATDPAFFQQLAAYILKNNLAGMVALEVLDENHHQGTDGWTEYELEGGSTVVLSMSDTTGGVFVRATGWIQRCDETTGGSDPDPQPGTTYAKTTTNTHRVFVTNKIVQDEKQLISALEAANIFKTYPSQLI